MQRSQSFNTLVSGAAVPTSNRHRSGVERPEPYLSPPAIKALRELRGSADLGARESTRQQIVNEGIAARAKIDHEIEALRNMMRGSDPLHLYGALHMWDSCARNVLRGAELHGSDALLEFFAGLVTSQPEADTLANLGMPFDPQIVLDAENQLRTIAELQASIDFGEAFKRRPKSVIDNVIGMLLLERHFDRMSGFDRHLRRIADATFDRVDELAMTTLGYKLGDALRFADVHAQILLDHWQSTADRIAASHPPPDPEADESEKLQWMFTDMLALVLDAAAPVATLDDSEALATQLGLTAESFDKLTSALATPLGSQEVRDLHGDNTIRNHPIIQASTGQWMWCRPVDFVHSMLDWAFDMCQPFPDLLHSFDKARQHVAEELPGDVLKNIFGDDRVYLGVTYPDAESDAEADIIVALPGALLIVECKGGRITGPARRGAPKRVEKHVDDTIVKAANQNLRTATAIEAGLTLRDEKGRVVPVQQGDLSLGIICIFDRIDPFNTYLGRPSNGNLEDRSWIITLADLVLVADVLPTPAEFFAYVGRRVEMTRKDSHRVIVEADALGAWCEDRLTQFRPVAPGRFTLVDETSDLINDYFIQDDAAQEIPTESVTAGRVPRPTANVPEVVLNALSRLLAAGNPLWAARCTQVFEIRPSEWRVFNRRLALVQHPESARARTDRKSLAHARRGFLVAGSLPVRFQTADGPSGDDEQFLVIESDRA
jgi:hypothetical protein